ncbi:nuclear transport factor 2 family protein [Microbacterium testaceum]|uniref:nuclear transport factor 2 family protein n=1 Tax=Microbacterium testaceum TaxID=2033 RepID=UPI002AC6C5C6|nr:nuclear transport factor 2 family protein [Microbacterium testaceum]MDZ5145128.1 nuclear transport factor 2 family protein [Microbacterium testaceum]
MPPFTPRITRASALVAGAALIGVLVGAAPASASPTGSPASTAPSGDRQNVGAEEFNACLVRTLFATTFTDPDSPFAQAIAGQIVAPDAIAHGSGTASGPQGLLAQFAADRERLPGAQAVIKHLASDGDLVAVHWQIAPDPNDERRGDAAVDLFRLQDGKIVEHWSLDQAIPTGTPASGNTNTMFSDLYRPSQPTPPPTEQQEEKNRVFAVSAYNTLFRDKDVSILDRAFDPAYLQHNSIAPNGTAALKQLFGSGAQFPAQQSVISLSDGDIVWTFSQAVGDGPDDPLLAADLFRVNGGLIREHWDVVPTR